MPEKHALVVLRLGNYIYECSHFNVCICSWIKKWTFISAYKCEQAWCICTRPTSMHIKNVFEKQNDSFITSDFYSYIFHIPGRITSSWSFGKPSHCLSSMAFSSICWKDLSCLLKHCFPYRMTDGSCNGTLSFAYLDVHRFAYTCIIHTHMHAEFINIRFIIQQHSIGKEGTAHSGPISLHNCNQALSQGLTCCLNSLWTALRLFTSGKSLAQISDSTFTCVK